MICARRATADPVQSSVGTDAAVALYALWKCQYVVYPSMVEEPNWVQGYNTTGTHDRTPPSLPLRARSLVRPHAVLTLDKDIRPRWCRPALCLGHCTIHYPRR